MLIPKLFDAIRLGNVKSEYVLGDRIIGKRQVRLKLVAEVVDPGSNPLATHSQMRTVHEEQDGKDKPAGSCKPANQSANTVADTSDANRSAAESDPSGNAASRRGPRRKHPMSRST